MNGSWYTSRGTSVEDTVRAFELLADFVMSVEWAPSSLEADAEGGDTLARDVEIRARVIREHALEFAAVVAVGRFLTRHGLELSG